MTGVEIPDVRVGDVWRVAADHFRILALPEKRRGPWSTDRTPALMGHAIRVTNMDPTVAEPAGGHWIDETCFPHMELVARYGDDEESAA